MFVRQSRNTFIRFYDDKVYITNQMTRYDRVYNETGADFLSNVNRAPQNVDSIIDKLLNLYGDSVSREQLSNDFYRFIADLENNFFLVTGDTPEECEKKDFCFSYSLGNMKTQVNEYNQNTEQTVEENTCDFF